VFEEFRQVGRDYTRKQEGTGLGLALTKRFVELLGGEVRVKSEVGKGSTFTIAIPAGMPRQPAPDPRRLGGEDSSDALEKDGGLDPPLPPAES